MKTLRRLALKQGRIYWGVWKYYGRRFGIHMLGGEGYGMRYGIHMLGGDGCGGMEGV